MRALAVAVALAVLVGTVGAAQRTASSPKQTFLVTAQTAFEEDDCFQSFYTIDTDSVVENVTTVHCYNGGTVYDAESGVVYYFNYSDHSMSSGETPYLAGVNVLSGDMITPIAVSVATGAGFTNSDPLLVDGVVYAALGDMEKLYVVAVDPTEGTSKLLFSVPASPATTANTYLTYDPNGNNLLLYCPTEEVIDSPTSSNSHLVTEIDIRVFCLDTMEIGQNFSLNTNSFGSITNILFVNDPSSGAIYAISTATGGGSSGGAAPRVRPESESSGSYGSQGEGDLWALSIALLDTDVGELNPIGQVSIWSEGFMLSSGRRGAVIDNSGTLWIPATAAQNALYCKLVAIDLTALTIVTRLTPFYVGRAVIDALAIMSD